jgi:hypothetical protein
MAGLERSLPHSYESMNLDAPIASAGAACSVLDVLPYLGKELGLQGLACLASSSRQLRGQCISFVRGNAHGLLLDALPAVRADQELAAAAARQPPTNGAAAAARRCLQPVLWITKILLPRAAGSVLAAADVLQRLVHIPHVPLQQAQQLVAAGVRLSYAQLLTAASSMVAGVEVWVQALEQVEFRNGRGTWAQRLPTLAGIPPAAVAICCSHARDWVSWHKSSCLLLISG